MELRSSVAVDGMMAGCHRDRGGGGLAARFSMSQRMARLYEPGQVLLAGCADSEFNKKTL